MTWEADERNPLPEGDETFARTIVTYRCIRCGGNHWTTLEEDEHGNMDD